MSRSCQRWSEDTARHVWLRPCRAVSFPADTVREAEQLKTRDVQISADIDAAAHLLAQWSRRVFGPRLVVLRVASNIWRQTVSRMASVSSVALIDVSEPTGNLIWEIEELTRRSQAKCVFICRHDRALEIAAAAASVSPSSFDDDMGRLLEMEEILAYTTDRSGITRSRAHFAAPSYRAPREFAAGATRR